MNEVLSYRNQSIDLQSKSVDWFLYDRDLYQERVNMLLFKQKLKFEAKTDVVK